MLAGSIHDSLEDRMAAGWFKSQQFRNKLNKNISFTIETEYNGKISFLDTLVSRKNGVIAVDVYRKPTHTDRYLDFNSHHNNLHKASTASTLLHRALNLPNSSEGIKRELNYVHAALESNGYPSKFQKVFTMFHPGCGPSIFL